MTEPAAEDGTDARPVPFISRVRIKNYKSIASCDVRLGPLTILVGPNGSGKSNFLDALAFLARALETTPAEAIDERGGLDAVIRRVPDQAPSFSIGVEATFPRSHASTAIYHLEIGPSPQGSGLEVIREELDWPFPLWREAGSFRNEHGQVVVDLPNRRQDSANLAPDRLFLQLGLRPFAPLSALLSSSRFYNFNPETLRKPQPAATRPLLRHAGEGLGDVLSALAENSVYKARVDAYMSAIVQDATAIEAHRVGGYMTVALKSGIDGKEFEFDSLSMSDGTIRAAAVLAALFQPESLNGELPLIGIEEPEMALHPVAAGVLFDALSEASEHVQVIATSQSADLLDREDLDVSSIRPVTMRDGLTVIGEVDDASREIVRQKLYTLGELMRGNQLSPAPSDGGVSEG